MDPFASLMFLGVLGVLVLLMPDYHIRFKNGDKAFEFKKGSLSVKQVKEALKESVKRFLDGD